MVRAVWTALATIWPFQLSACDLALLFAVDVSGSVDQSEFETQMNGLAAGLRDGVVSESLVQAKAALSLVQWTGASRQALILDWKRINSFPDIVEFADQISRAPREWRNFSTAIGEALIFSGDVFDDVADCGRRVIDVSGDGVSNEGIAPTRVHGSLNKLNITVNALVIEGEESDLTAYYWENVITGEGAFVETANGYSEYPIRMRQKLLREITKQLASESSADGSATIDKASYR